MGNVQQQLGNSTSASLVHQLGDLWKSHRGTVLRIEAFVLVAIALSFFLGTFGSCRRWSNRWILQKGFLVANALFLSLGTYSIGLMQSSSVKSEMYPIWAVSLLAFMCCVDSVTSYSLDSISQFWKMIYQLCLYVGYILLMSISTMSSDLAGNIAVGMLSAITFFKGFHRTLALLLPSRMRYMITALPDGLQEKIDKEMAESATRRLLVVHLSLYRVEPRANVGEATKRDYGDITLHDIYSMLEDYDLGSDADAFKDVCISASLSHLLHRRTLGFNRVLEIRTQDDSLVSNWILLNRASGTVNYERAFKVVELELAFLYDVLFANNAFLHYYATKTASVWAVASFIGICFVGVVVAITGTRTTHAPGSTNVVGTTSADLAITGVILVSLALLQLLQLLHCWTSYWARVGFACDLVRDQNEGTRRRLSWHMRLRASLSKINWFHKYLWQNSIGQHSLVESISTRESKLSRKFKGYIFQAHSRFSGALGLPYFEQLLKELWGNSTGDVIELHADVKASIADCLNGVRSDNASMLELRRWLGIVNLHREEEVWTADKYPRLILMWHIATCYCELVLQQRGTESEKATVRKNHCVATALSKYCAYLVISVPRLLPGQHMDTKYVYDAVAGKAGEVLRGVEDILGSMDIAVETVALGRVRDLLSQKEGLIRDGETTMFGVRHEFDRAIGVLRYGIHWIHYFEGDMEGTVEDLHWIHYFEGDMERTVEDFFKRHSGSLANLRFLYIHMKKIWVKSRPGSDFAEGISWDEISKWNHTMNHNILSGDVKSIKVKTIHFAKEGMDMLEKIVCIIDGAEKIREKLNAIDWERETDCFRLFKDELGAMDKSGVLEMGKKVGVEGGFLPVKDELDTIETRWAREVDVMKELRHTLNSALAGADIQDAPNDLEDLANSIVADNIYWVLFILHRTTDETTKILNSKINDMGKETSELNEKFIALEEERQRLMDALSRARDKLVRMEEERKSRGIHRYDPDDVPGGQVFWSGIALGYRLQSQAVLERWKVLADFWVKALLYAAPSDNVEEHVQHLAQGGEFITHVWALLHHHGILRWREEQQQDLSRQARWAEGQARIYAG